MQPVLLMELCDESLTRFLERSPGPLPYHTQLNISHDIALAVVYLHTNGLYHRDLSSNNILLDHGRAKVTDFGMSKLADIQVQHGTLCPGNVLYMPPEALDEPPTYTDKLDIFSFGVLLVQILTRKFPKPTNRLTVTYVQPSQQFPKGIAHIPVSETTRRQDHLRLINNAHPLKAIALKCLSDSDKDRPTSSDLSLSLSSLKATPEYARSLREETEERRSRTQLQQPQGYTEELDRRHRDYEEELQRHLRSRDEQLEQAKVQLQNLADTRDQVEQLKLQLQGQRKLTDFANQKLKEKLEEKRKEMEKKNLELNDSQELVAYFQKTLNEGEKETKKEFQQSLKQKEMRIKELEDSVLLKDKKINDLEFTIKMLQTAPKGPGGMGEVEGGQHKDMTALRWEVAETAPVEMSAGSAVAIGEDIYVSPDSSKVVYCYNPLRKWSALPQCECVGFSLAAVENTLTTVGGRDDNFTNKLFSFVDHRDWQEKLPPMPTARTEPTTLCTGQHLIAAGGFSGTRTLDTIEVLTMADKQWTTCASSLPHRVSGGSMWLCDRQLYLAPRDVDSVGTQQMVLTCPMDNLFKPPKRKAFGRASGPWEKIANLPIPLASVVSLNGHILALGGKDTQNGPSYTSTRVYVFSPASGGSGSWKNVSGMTKGRWSSIAAVLPGDRLIVVGGQSHWQKTNIVEIATL